jgi:hypothetical protein
MAQYALDADGGLKDAFKEILLTQLQGNASVQEKNAGHCPWDMGSILS